MNLDFLLLADRVEPSEGQKLDIVGAAWDTITANSVPTVRSEISVVIRVLARPEETVNPHVLELALLGSKGEEITSLTGDINPIAQEEVDQAPQDRMWRLIWVLQLRDLNFPEFGPYEFSVRVDAIELGRSQLYVKPPA